MLRSWSFAAERRNLYSGSNQEQSSCLLAQFSEGLIYGEGDTQQNSAYAAESYSMEISLPV
jgi:hypothetical protein